VNKRILLVEDHDISRRVAQAFLQQAGYQVVVAINGTTALAAACVTRPALILMDLSLPDMDGQEVTRRLREHSRTAHIPVVMVTASALPRDEARCLAAGCAGYITKPLNRQRFLRAVAGLLSPDTADSRHSQEPPAAP
jgi:CheY-like chemotaxis protein